MAAAPLTLRALRTATFAFGRKYSRSLVLNQEFTIPAAKITLDVLTAVRTYVNAGKLEVLSAAPSHGLAVQKPSLARNQLHVILGLDQGSGIVLPNGATVHKLLVGGVPFLLGDGNIDGATASTQLAAFVAALNASADFLATGARVASSSVLADVAEVAASLVLTSDNTNVSDGDTVTVGTTVYRFKNTMSQAYDVKIGTDADTTLLNLAKAINGSGIAGTNYFAGTVAHTLVTSSATVTAHAITITAKTGGRSGNSIATAEASTHLSWTAGGTNLAGGLDAHALVIIDGDDVDDWTAFCDDTALTDTSDAALIAPAMSITLFSASTHDSTLAENVVAVSRTVTSGDVTRGYIGLDTGLTDLDTHWAVKITRSGARIAHNGSQTVVNSRMLLIQNEGNADFAAGDIVQAFAYGG